jgi:alkanesulfonate monooxygenase SsuD/methylene tetrahydromethanopterin reductase-like flavin-dependent oxidoreductase (luciferase family)
MALRLQLAPQALRILSGCPSTVRERLQAELGALAAGLPLDGPPVPGGAGLVVLDSGFRVRYRLERSHRLLLLTHMQAPSVQVR